MSLTSSSAITFPISTESFTSLKGTFLSGWVSRRSKGTLHHRSRSFFLMNSMADPPREFDYSPAPLFVKGKRGGVAGETEGFRGGAPVSFQLT
jgi:hypothetical protein